MVYEKCRALLRDQSCDPSQIGVVRSMLQVMETTHIGRQAANKALFAVAHFCSRCSPAGGHEQPTKLKENYSEWVGLSRTDYSRLALRSKLLDDMVKASNLYGHDATLSGHINCITCATLKAIADAG